MKPIINTESCISVGKNLIYREAGLYILEIYETTLEDIDYYITYGTFKELTIAIDIAKRINRTRNLINR